MRFDCFLFSVFLFISAGAQAEVLFVSVPKVASDQWQKAVLERFDAFNKLAPTEGSVPQALNVYYEKNIDPTYRPTFSFLNSNMQFKTVDGVISLGDFQDDDVAHEYGHAIFDYYMRSESEVWQYYIIKRRIAYDTLEIAFNEYQKVTASLKRDREKYEAVLAESPGNDFASKALKNINNSLNQYLPHLPMVEYGKQFEAKYGAKKLQHFPHFDFLESYQEFFADAFAVVYFNDWSIMKRTIEQGFLNNPEHVKKYVLPPASSDQEAIALNAEQRGFPQGVNLNHYDFKNWQGDSAYWQFLPARSYFRNRVEETGNPKQVLGELLAAIKLVYEDAFINGAKAKSLRDKNRCLIHAMQTGTLCTFESTISEVKN